MSIARQAAHGVAWNMAWGISTRVLTLVGQVVLAHYLLPAEAGETSNAAIAVLTANAFTAFSFGQYLITKRASPEVAFQAWVVHVGLGLVALAAVYPLRGAICGLFGTPEAARYVLGYALSYLIIDRLRYVPERLLMRSLRFRALATINGLGEIAYIVASIATVRAWHAYALVFGAIVKSLVTSVLFLWAAPRSEWLVRARLRIADIRDLVTYGVPILIAIVTDNATKRWDNLVVSRLFGAGVVGAYNYAYNLAETPISYVAEHIGEVLMPSFSRMAPEQRDRAAIASASLMSLVVSPLGVGLGAVAPTAVAAFFNPAWQERMTPMLAILSVMFVFRPMTWSVTAYVQAVQRTRVLMLSSVLRAVLVLAGVGVCGYLGGPNWACIGAGIGFFVTTVATVAAAAPVTSLPIGAYLRAVARPLMPCVPMYLAVLATERGLAAAGAPLVVSLVVQIMVGAIVYIAAAFALVRPTVDELIRVARGAIHRKR
ncbi:MAG TPA: oligosaccharide flippase family protein [Kofleriaceae bacterium]|nr:oligosaccharide flippase family protein [Kofleriaceae bacterium]